MTTTTNTITTMGTTTTNTATATGGAWSVAKYRAWLDQQEAKYPEVKAERAVRRVAKLHLEARVHLARAKRYGERLELRVAAVEDAMDAFLAAQALHLDPAIKP